MTLQITISHAAPGYSASAVVSVAGQPDQVVDSGETCTRYVHQSADVRVSELQPGQTLDAWKERAAQRAWAAYSRQAGGKTFDGKPLPTWVELGEERQLCWLAAVEAL
ncbi:MAG: hypothetical protein I8H71_00410 [Xanthomonadaceae bacterium]|nr:hypothetical protein [Xanthomonadaceae bacterium]MBH2008135.1 hypothetical protein [Xanthomonadaceae bacterium]